MSHCHVLRLLALLCIAGDVLAAAETSQTERPGMDLFEIHARPLFVSHCVRCHGESKQEAGLSLATHDGLLAGGDSGAAVVPGRPAESLLLDALRYESFEMPPTGRLEDTVIAGIEQWVAAGAPWPKGTVLAPANPISAGDQAWWCYQPRTSPTVPELPPESAVWCHNEIDAFIMTALAKRGIAPAPLAPPRAFLRRVHYAVTGLPVSERLLGETDDGATLRDHAVTQRIVDELLDSPAYGEHQARFWLDLVRYADSDGYRADGARPLAKHYRDYCVRSFNSDKPYDTFVMEQLAGDEIDPGNRDAIIATMFLRHWIYEWNQRDVEGQWQKILDDLTETTADVFLAQSLKCARCHDHKFDPLLQKDYYRLQAFYAAFRPTETQPVADLATLQAHAARRQVWEQATADIRRRLDEIERPLLIKYAKGQQPKMFPPEIQAMIAKRPEDRSPYERQIAELAERQFEFLPEKLEQHLDESLAVERKGLLEQLAAYEGLKPEPLPTQGFVATDIGPVAPHICIPDDRTNTPINPGYLTLLDAGPAVIEPPSSTLGTTGRRTALARWITSPANPLTARVIVNRVWQQHFGRGLSASASDFGHLGQPPTHPELLDWLASWFVREGWSLKRLHRLILTSATFRQASDRQPDAQIASIDPENKLLWRMNPRRLSGEEIADTIRTATGAVSSANTEQRAIYKPVLRNKPDPLLAAFDFPERIQSAGERHQTTTPTQALLLANGEWAHSQAQAVGRRLQSLTDHDFIKTLYRQLFGREANAEEIEDSLTFLETHQRITPTEQTPPEAGQLSPWPGVGKGLAKHAVALDPESPLAIELPEVACLPEADFTVRAVVLLRSLYADAKVRTLAATWSGNPKQPGWSLGVTSTKSRYQPRNVILQLVGKTEDAENTLQSSDRTGSAIFHRCRRRPRRSHRSRNHFLCS
jgi:mono/diheme cytochrome c family protein